VFIWVEGSSPLLFEIISVVVFAHLQLLCCY
jgi:hypothetical protein